MRPWRRKRFAMNLTTIEDLQDPVILMRKIDDAFATSRELAKCIVGDAGLRLILEIDVHVAGCFRTLNVAIDPIDSDFVETISSEMIIDRISLRVQCIISAAYDLQEIDYPRSQKMLTDLAEKTCDVQARLYLLRDRMWVDEHESWGN